MVTNLENSQTYVLYPCGNTQPSASSPGIPEDTTLKYFATPIQSAAFTETVSLTFYEVLNLASVVGG